MRRLGGSMGSGRLVTLSALFGVALVAVLGVPLLARAGGPETAAMHRHPLWEHLTVQACEERRDGEHPRMDEFLGVLVTDGVISQEQADEIASRLVERRFTGCVSLVLFQPGTMIDATAELTRTERREVVGWLVAGDSLSAYAAQHGHDDAALAAAIMERPEARAAELVASGELDQATADAALACIERRVNELIKQPGINPGRLLGTAGPGGFPLEGTTLAP